jgi:hypothetical protein
MEEGTPIDGALIISDVLDFGSMEELAVNLIGLLRHVSWRDHPKAKEAVYAFANEVQAERYNTALWTQEDMPAQKVWLPHFR